ncbi:ABC transporter ATP-binding protein [Lutibaculum baratangense]|uniref:Branched-chain amino acid ABC transporter, ATP-binding protein n=1 Tax=Lutibaculum baratangense AMV1 TaxID=631454 RepID=V4RQ54_9HYPH|nr:ABC transporter ATP-binding protein [Lutibaculum baratangense]ESR25315.1 branched-chain amino acid ABC transporter, ATP-binding protein [Lutibaculum baratangense AMV1]
MTATHTTEPAAGHARGGDDLLVIRGVSKRFGGLRALSNVNLTVEHGQIHAIIGPNGAGKSTLLNCMIGLIDADEGEVVFDGKPLKGLSPHNIMQRGIARVFQTPQVFPGMSLLDNVAIAALAKMNGQFRIDPFVYLSPTHPAVEEASEILRRLGLLKMAKYDAAHLSRGDKRRLELGICMACKPRLMLLDEPTAGMARHDTNRTIDLLREISATGITMIVIEHDMHVVFSLADVITCLAQGTPIAFGKPEEVRGNPKVREAYLGSSH